MSADHKPSSSLVRISPDLLRLLSERASKEDRSVRSLVDAAVRAFLGVKAND